MSACAESKACSENTDSLAAAAGSRSWNRQFAEFSTGVGNLPRFKISGEEFLTGRSEAEPPVAFL
jgi:hypothetical protein